MTCWPWQHQWELWKETERVELVRRHDRETGVEYANPKRIGNYLVQERKCLLCGKVQLRRESAYL